MLFGSVAKAQNPAEYIKWQGENEKFYNAYKAWEQGKALYTETAEDENFFISRVKPRVRFRNQQTQVDNTLTADRDKKVFNWVPIGMADGGNPNALPSGIYDSDVFSMWSYVDHYGNWTSPLIRMPGAFADAAHKNGVAVSSLASIPWSVAISSYDGSHGQNIQALIDGKAEKLIKLLDYYGIDGWGMNSEFSCTSTYAHNLQDFMADTYELAITKKKYPNYVMAWYTLVGNDGNMFVTDGLADGNMNYYHKNGRPVSNYVFGNYNWNSYQLQDNKDLAKAKGRNPLEIFAGMNLQGAQGKNWEALAKYPTSIGLWGAHNMNMFFESRNELGALPEVKQATYLGRTERFFSNGNQNPADKLPIKNGLTISYEGNKNFHGISAMSSAKSALAWSLDEEPFYSFFNMGNGQFFNIKGDKAYKGEWYNIGMQDYLPTWRYWFAKDYLSTNIVENGLKATFTWDDAWFGGSCMKIYGTSATEYLHLFKTKFALKQGDKIRLRFKVVSGTADIKLVASAEGKEANEVGAYVLKSDDIELGEWVEAVVEVNNSGRTTLKLADKVMAVTGLKFENAQDLELRLGEFSILRGELSAPAQPTIHSTYTKLLKRTFKGLDAKVIFDMARPANLAKDAHIYNSDVKTAFFKVYIKQDGKKSFVTATTSWAALLFSAPYNDKGSKKVQIGVSAVGLDGVTESPISWSKELVVKDDLLQVGDNIVIDKPTVKPSQEFTIKFEDPNHIPATWIVKNNKTGATIKTFENVKSFTYSELTELGLYDVIIKYDGKTKMLPGFIQITAESVGSVPEIKTLTFNGSSEESVKADPKQVNDLAYTGRKADGAGSRGLLLEEAALGFSPVSMFGEAVPAIPDYTIAFWMKFNSLVPDKDGINLLNIRNPNMKWPNNNWGYIWSTYNPTSKRWEITKRGKSNQHQKNIYDVDFKVGTWQHITLTFKKLENGNLLMKFYLNGKYMPTSEFGPEHGAKTKGDNVEGWHSVTSLNKDYWMMFGGKAHQLAGLNGVLDDVKFYDVALTAEQVAKQMYSTTPEVDEAKEGLVGFWDFEGEANADNKFVSSKGKTGKAELLVGEMADNSSAGEGKTILTPLPPKYEAGSAFVSGTNFKVVTTAKWFFEKGQLAEAQGNDMAGSAKLTYKKDGIYSGKLVLSNSWGKAEREIKVITIGNPNNTDEPTPNNGNQTAVEDVEALSLKAFPNPFVENVNLHFAVAGKYTVAIYDMAGQLVNSKVLNAHAGSIVAINVEAPKGIYLMRVVAENGKVLRTIKLQKN